MPPEDYYTLPPWESDFWTGLLNDAYQRPQGTRTGQFHAEPEPVRSEYWTEDTLVGEVVDEQLEIGS